jgi:phosphoribulokinase
LGLEIKDAQEELHVAGQYDRMCHGGKMPPAMQLIFTPMIWKLMERRRQS